MLNNTRINFALFQLGWCVTVFGAAYGYPIVGCIYALIWGTFHVNQSKARQSEIILILFAAALGFFADSLLVLNGNIAFPDHAQLGYPTAFWMVSLWVMFAMTLKYSLAWLSGRLVFAALLGLIFGPLAYWAGSNIGSILIEPTLFNLLWIGTIWCLSMISLNLVESLGKERTVNS